MIGREDHRWRERWSWEQQGEKRGEGTGERESAEGRVLRREGKERRGRKGRGDGEADIHAVWWCSHSHLVKIHYAVVRSPAWGSTTQHVYQPHHLSSPSPPSSPLSSLSLHSITQSPSRDFLSKVMQTSGSPSLSSPLPSPFFLFHPSSLLPSSHLAHAFSSRVMQTPIKNEQRAISKPAALQHDALTLQLGVDILNSILTFIPLNLLSFVRITCSFWNHIIR